MFSSIDLACGCRRQLDDAEGDLIDALVVTRESLARCEQALALLAAARNPANTTCGNHLSPRVVGSPVGAGVIDQSVGEPPREPATAERLSPRELQILRLIADGMSNREIADALFLSARTVERHIANIYPKIGAHNKAAATAYALRQHLA